jgi:hypothetical protein
MTAHSPVGMQPEKFNVRKESLVIGSFANNDIMHIDETGTEHELFSFGLKKSLLNFMHGICLTDPLQKWFDFKVPKTKISPDYIVNALTEDHIGPNKPTAKVVWLGKTPSVENFTKSKKGNTWEMASLTFQNKKEKYSISVDQAQGNWLAGMLEKLSVNNAKTYTLKEVIDSYTEAGLEDFELFWDNKPVNTLYKFGLLKL